MGIHVKKTVGEIISQNIVVVVICLGASLLTIFAFFKPHDSPKAVNDYHYNPETQSKSIDNTQTSSKQSGNLPNNSDAVSNQFNKALKALDEIDIYVRYSMKDEPNEYLSLVARAGNEIRTANASGKPRDYIVKTYHCYYEVGAMWTDNNPSALVSKGLVTLYLDAKNTFERDTLPGLVQKLAECSKYLENAHELVEAKQR